MSSILKDIFIPDADHIQTKVPGCSNTYVWKFTIIYHHYVRSLCPPARWGSNFLGWNWQLYFLHENSIWENFCMLPGKSLLNTRKTGTNSYLELNSRPSFYYGYCDIHQLTWSIMKAADVLASNKDLAISNFYADSTVTTRKIYNIRRTRSPNLNVTRLVLQLSLPNQLKPGFKSIMKM